MTGSAVYQTFCPGCDGAAHGIVLVQKWLFKAPYGHQWVLWKCLSHRSSAQMKKCFYHFFKLFSAFLSVWGGSLSPVLLSTPAVSSFTWISPSSGGRRNPVLLPASQAVLLSHPHQGGGGSVLVTLHWTTLFYWGITDIQPYIRFKCTTSWFNICIHCKMITTISVVSMHYHT